MSVFIQISKKGSAKECLNYQTIAITSHASKVMVKILQARLQVPELSTVRCTNLAGKGMGTRDQIANTRRIIEKAIGFQKKKSTSFH